MDGLQAINQLNNLQKSLDETISLMSKQGKELSECERDYKIALMEEVLKLRDDGMAATLINLVVYGVPRVAKLRQERDFAQSRYEVSKEKIMSLKLNIRVLEGIVEREWGRA